MAAKKDLVRAYYDEFADVYDVKHGVVGAGQSYNFQRYYEPFLTEHVPEAARVLELGCGTGVYTRWLLDRGCTVVAMDISPNILEQARRRCPEGTFYAGDCEDPASALPADLQAGVFDAIVGVNTFSYYPNKGPALANYRALLKPGGRIVLIDMNGRCPFYRIMTWTDKNEMGDWYPQVCQSNSVNLGRLVQEAGYRLRQVTHFAFIPNALGPAAVGMLRPFDAVFRNLPGVRQRAMRLGLVAELA
jgi:ubiquinone/menaquinone biosynthesis C-methylase UbiE